MQINFGFCLSVGVSPTDKIKAKIKGLKNALIQVPAKEKNLFFFLLGVAANRGGGLYLRCPKTNVLMNGRLVVAKKTSFLIDTNL